MGDTDPLILKLYDALRNTFGLGDNDLFQMEMPARLLDMGNYHYPGSDSLNAQQLKPPAVGEAEFRLADGMLNLSNLVGGPNGSRMAERYHQILFGLVPANVETSAELGKLVPDQQKIFDWLYEEVPNFDPPASDLLSMIPDDKHLPPKPNKIREKNPSPNIDKLRDSSQTPNIPRIDLYQKLLDVYEAERFRLLTTYAPVIDAKLEALWSVLLVRGQYHRVRKYISYVDIETVGETLQHAKEALRASVTRSIDDTEDVYPVVFTPNNWAKYLSTNFRPEDLLADADNTRNSLRVAEKERAILSLRRDALVGGRQDIKALEKAAADVGIALQKASEPPLSADQWKSLVEMQTKCLQNQQKVMTTNDALSNAQRAASQARGEDPTNSLEVINERIQSLTMDIEYYQKMLQAAENPMGVPVTRIGEDGKLSDEKTAASGASKPATTPVAPDSQDGASVWQWCVIDSEKSKATSTKLSSTSVSHSDWSMGLWFASGSGHSNSATTDASKKATTDNTHIQIGFRAMKVTIDRPWFKGQILGQTKEFFHFNANKISAGDSNRVHEMMKNGDHVDGTQCILPSWTTAFVVVKDVHIILTSHSEFEDSEIHDMQSASASGGGFLCFQASKSASSSDHRDAFSMTSDKNTISIRIPAPQILGWVTQLAPRTIR